MAIKEVAREKPSFVVEKRNSSIKKALELCEDWTPIKELVEGCGYCSYSNFGVVLDEMVSYGLVRSKPEPNDPERKKSRYHYLAVKTYEDYLAMKEAEVLRSRRSKPYLLLDDDSEYADKVKETARLHAKSTINRIGKSSILGVDFVN